MVQAIVQGHGFHQIEDIVLKWVCQWPKEINAPPKEIICIAVYKVEGLGKYFLD